MTELDEQLDRLDRLLDAQEFIPRRIRCDECDQYFVPDDDDEDRICDTCRRGEQ